MEAIFTADTSQKQTTYYPSLTKLPYKNKIQFKFNICEHEDMTDRENTNSRK